MEAEDYSTITATNCTLTSNYARLGGGAVAVQHGNSTVTTADCSMRSNSAGVGGAVYIADVSTGGKYVISGCDLIHNRADDEVKTILVGLVFRLLSHRGHPP